VSFCAIAGGRPAGAHKRTPAGRSERLVLLTAAFEGELSARPPAGAGLDDLYDAGVLAWTAARAVRGAARRLPMEPSLDRRGLRMEIVY
jgi:predicted RNase H-like nuclease